MFPCCCSATAWMRCCLGVWQKEGGRCSGWWLKAVTEEFWRHIFTEVPRAREKSQLLYSGCVSFTDDWLFWNLYGSYIASRPLLSWNKSWKCQSFDNMFLYIFYIFYCKIIAFIYIWPVWHYKCKQRIFKSAPTGYRHSNKYTQNQIDSQCRLLLWVSSLLETPIQDCNWGFFEQSIFYIV